MYVACLQLYEARKYDYAQLPLCSRAMQTKLMMFWKQYATTIVPKIRCYIFLLSHLAPIVPIVCNTLTTMVCSKSKHFIKTKTVIYRFIFNTFLSMMYLVP